MLKRIPAKTEVSRALQRLATTHMASSHKARDAAIFKSSHAKVDELEESSAHDVVVVRSYITHLESRVRALESEMGNGELESIPDSEIESSCGCGGAK